MTDMAPSQVLVTVEPTIDFFLSDERVEQALSEIRGRVSTFKADVSTSRGRKEIASMAYSVAKAKTTLDDAGKEIVAKQKEIPKKIDASRKLIRDTLDAIKDRVRAPLTKWEQEEEQRVAMVKASIAEIEDVIADNSEQPAALLRAKLDEMQRLSISDQFFAEFVDLAQDARKRAIEHLTARIATAETREAERAELERLRAAEAARATKDREEAAAREQQEREARIAQEAAERAKAEAAEAVAAAERAAAEAEQRARETEARIKREADEAAEREAAEARQREKNRSHRAAVNRAAVAGLVAGGIDEDVAKAVVTLIAKGKVPHVSLAY